MTLSRRAGFSAVRRVVQVGEQRIGGVRSLRNMLRAASTPNATPASAGPRPSCRSRRGRRRSSSRPTTSRSRDLRRARFPLEDDRGECTDAEERAALHAAAPPEVQGPPQGPDGERATGEGPADACGRRQVRLRDPRYAVAAPPPGTNRTVARLPAHRWQFASTGEFIDGGPGRRPRLGDPGATLARGPGSW